MLASNSNGETAVHGYIYNPALLRVYRDLRETDPKPENKWSRELRTQQEAQQFFSYQYFIFASRSSDEATKEELDFTKSNVPNLIIIVIITRYLSRATSIMITDDSVV